jgi:hypothetical protein
MRDAAWLEGDVLSKDECLRRCSNMTLFIAVEFALPFFFFSCNELVELCSRSTEPRFLDREARLLIWVRRWDVADGVGTRWCSLDKVGRWQGQGMARGRRELCAVTVV